METVLRIALSNAALASVAAVLAWTAGRLVRKPALTHVLWLIVLLKFVTPPLWTVPLRLPADTQSKMTRDAAPRMPIAPEVQWDNREINLAVVDLNSDATSTDAAGTFDAADRIALDQTPFAVSSAPNPIPPPLAASPPARRSLKSFLPFAASAIWIVGAAFCLTMSVRRILAFRRVLRYAVAAEPHYQRRVDLLCRRLGLGAGPTVELVPGAVCPMLWSAGARPRILVPGGLWDRLDGRQRDTLLLHELAHLRRRDHWVRWIELLATALYWWHPVCWWARHELREAEEQCCDAWVLWALPDSFADYASALLEAVDFVSVRPSVPLLASGMGQFGHLKRRLTMLKQGNVARALTWTGFTAACGAGALLLSIAPTLAQSAAPATSEKREAPDGLPAGDAGQSTAPVAVQERSESNREAKPVSPPPAPAKPDAAPSAAAGTPGLTPLPPGEALFGGADSSSASPSPEALPKPQTADGNFRRDMAREEADRARASADMARQMAAMKRGQADLDRARKDVAELSRRLQQAADRLKQLEMAAVQGELSKYQDFSKTQLDWQKQIRIDGQPRIITVPPMGDNVIVAPRMPDGTAYAPIRRPGARQSTESDRDRRLDAVEKQLSQLLNEVKKLRTDREDAPPQPTPQYQKR